MAQEWYLLKSPHSQLSGYEGDALTDFAAEGFLEILDSEIAVDVELCNYDLSECKQIRAVVENKVQDTKLKTLSRMLLVPVGTCKSGMYIKYKNRYWLITGLVDDNSMYEKAVMQICNYYLTWVNDNGKIIQRWANITSASQYNNGERMVDDYSNARTDQLMILTPDDDECLLLHQGKRFIIDRRCRVYEKSFDETVEKDTSNPVIVYQLTRADSVLFDYQNGGHYEFMAYQDEQREQDGYYVVDGKGYWLCEAPNIENKNDVLSCSIEYDSLEIFNGLEPGIFTAKFYDNDGNEVDATPNWEIRCEFADKLDVSYANNSILISADDSKLVNKSFELFLSGDGYNPATITVTIRAFF